jgi:hypothetical protein
VYVCVSKPMLVTMFRVNSEFRINSYLIHDSPYARDD